MAREHVVGRTDDWTKHGVVCENKSTGTTIAAQQDLGDSSVPKRIHES